MLIKAKTGEQAVAAVEMNGSCASSVSGGGMFRVECFDSEGNLKWSDYVHNLVVNEGLEFMNEQFFSGSTYTATWYLGLISGPGPSTITASDVLASKAWAEFTDYTGDRKEVTFGAASLADPSVISNTVVPSEFVITGGGGTVAGAFLTNVDSGSSGVLFSASDFEAPGDRAVVANDTIRVTYEFSLAAT